MNKEYTNHLRIENVIKPGLRKFRSSLFKFIISITIVFTFQSCTAWPMLTALLGVVGDSKDGGGMLLLPPFGESSSETTPVAETPEEPVITEPPIIPGALDYPGFPANLYQGIAITPITATHTSTITSCSVSPALPAGLILDATTCEISGTPTLTTPTNTYTITGSNVSGSTDVDLTFAVLIPPPSNLSYASFPIVLTVGVGMATNTPTVTGVVSNCISSPMLPAGLSLNAITCAISGTPTVGASTLTYVITPSNLSGNGDSFSLDFSVEPYPIVQSVSSSKANGAYKEGSTIPIQVTFNKNVTVTGSPQLVLSTGSPVSTYINYSGNGSGTNTLEFTYTVAAGNASADLSYSSAASLILNSGFIRDSQLNDASLTLPTPGNPNSLSANKNIVIDTTIPVISSVTPTSNAIINSTTLSYTLSEVCSLGNTTWTRVGGSADSGSPHIANWTGSELNAGTRTQVILTNNPTLVDNAIYDMSFNCTDPAGNIATSVLSSNVAFLTGALEIVSAETMDTDNNGKIDTYRISFNKSVKDSTFPGYVTNAIGGTTTSWLVAGYTDLRLIHGSAVTFATDTIDDAVIYLRFNESPLECSAATQVGCDTAAKPDLSTNTTPGLEDLATNKIAQVTTISVTEVDGARPILVGARSLGANLADAIFSEPIEKLTAESIPNYNITPAITVTAAVRDNTNTNLVHLTTSSQIGGDSYTLDVNTAVKDLANFNLSSVANTTTFMGLVKPVVSGIVTLTATTIKVTFNEPVYASTSECNTQSTCALIYNNITLPVLNAVSDPTPSLDSASYILTVNPMIEGQAYTTTVKEDTVQSVASSEKMGNTNNSATFSGDGKPNANISLDTATSCPMNNGTTGIQRRVVVQYDQSVLEDGGLNAANNPSNYGIAGCITGDCSSGHPPANDSATSVEVLGGNKFAVDFTTSFDSDESQYQLRIQNVQDLTGNTVPLPGTFSFQCGNDTTPPSLISVTVVSATNSATVLLLNFSESIDNVTANISTNYKYDGNSFGEHVNSAARQTNTSQVKVIFVPGLPNGGHQLRVQNTQDLASNVILNNGVNNTQPFILNAPTGFLGGAVFNDPFDDGTPGANLTIYDGKLYLGADQTGSKLFETNFSLTTAQTISLDADGTFGIPYSSFNNYPADWSGCNSISYPGTKCNSNNAVSGVDTIYAACVGGTSTPSLTGIECTNQGGTEYMFIGALNTMGNYRSFWYTTTKSTDSTIFPFTEEWSGDAGGSAAYRSMNLQLFKDQLFVNFGAELGGGGRGGRICMKPSGCAGGDAFLAKEGFPQSSRIRRIGASGSNTLRNGAYNNVPGYGQGDANTQVLNAINVMYEHDYDGVGGNESQLYLANGGYYTNSLPTVAPWARTGTSDGGIVRSVLTYSTRASLPGDCSGSNGCSTYWEDVTPDSLEKWSRYLSIPYPQNSAVTGATNCGTSLIEMDCTEPYNLFVPSLKAIPYLKTAPNGDLFLLRNACSTKNLCRNGMSCTNGTDTWTGGFRETKQVCPPGNEIPQLWMMKKNCGDSATCSSSGWQLVAERGTTGRTDMGNSKNSHLSLLEIVGNYLYIGYDNSVNGANIWRVNIASIPSGTPPTAFTQVQVNGIGPDSGGSNQKLFSHAVVNDDGKNWLIITTRDGLGAARIYRTANDEDL